MNLVATREERGVHLRIARPGLAERVNGALDSGSIVLTAGAGCGKTIAIEQALAHRPAPHLWLRCRPTDSDPGTLLRRLVQLLSEVAPGAVDLLAQRLAMAQERIDTRGAAQELVEELDRLLPAQIVVAFDDAEALAESPGATSLVGDLIAADSPVVRVAVATRIALPLRLAKLRASGRVTELGAGDLAFTAEECAELVAAAGRADADADRLFAATEGWPLGAALGVAHEDVPSLPARRRGRTSSSSWPRRRSIGCRQSCETRVVDSSITHELDAACAQALGMPEDFADQLAQVGLPVQDRRGRVAMARIPPTGAGVPPRPARAGAARRKRSVSCTSASRPRSWRPGERGGDRALARGGGMGRGGSGHHHRPARAS